MVNIKHKLTSTLLILSLVFTMFALNTIPAHAATTIKLKASASGQTQAVLTWNKISKPYSGYAVFRDGKVIKYFGTGTIKFTDSGLASGSAHTYQIKSYKKTKQYYNSKTKKWVTKKPKSSQWKGKKTRYVYSYKTKSNVVSIRTAYAYYTITWKNWNGSTLSTSSVRQGLTPSYSGTPTRPADTNYIYSFKSWSPSITTASGSKTYTATYTATQPTYTITWKNWNGNILAVTTVKRGVTPSYPNSNPKRSADANYVYDFRGWSPSLSPASGDKTYTAQYTATPRYTITWENWDGTILRRDIVKRGTTPKYPGTPTRPADDNYAYKFNGWSPTVVAANKPETYRATYTPIPINTYCTVRWLNWNDEILQSGSVQVGTAPNYTGTTPTREEDATYIYEFKGWSPTVSTVTEDITYRAQFKTYRKYTITWNNWDHTPLTTSIVKEGDTPVYPGTTPTRENEGNITYSFKGWTPELIPANGNKTYTAEFTAAAQPQSTTEYEYNIHVLDEPYGGTDEVIMAVYVETNNPNVYNYGLGILDSNNQAKKLNISKAYYKGSTTNTIYEDLELPINSGYLAICSPECTGNCKIVVYEYNDEGRSIVATKSVYIKNYYAEESAWRQSVINQVTNPSMSKEEKMNAICNYLLNNFNYTKIPNGTIPNVSPECHYITLLADAGTPYWIEKRLNSYTSPELLVKFGQDIDYSLHNCYNDYPEGSAEWKVWHMKVYSEVDDKYYSACPNYTTGYIDTSSIVIFNPNTYQFWGEYIP